MLNFIKTTVLGGVIFLVPIVIFVAIVGKALELAGKLAAPLAEALPVDSIGDLAVVHVLALAIVVLICFIAGMTARSQRAKHFVSALETSVLNNVPAYALLKAKANSILTPNDTREMRPVLVRFDDSWQVGFEVEKVNDEVSVVYLPGAPDPWSGSVCAVTRDRLHDLDLNVRSASDVLHHLGKGAVETFRKTLHEAPAGQQG